MKNDMTLRKEYEILTRYFKSLGMKDMCPAVTDKNVICNHSECKFCLFPYSHQECTLISVRGEVLDTYIKILHDWNEANPPRTKMNEFEEALKSKDEEKILREIKDMLFEGMNYGFSINELRRLMKYLNRPAEDT